MALAPSTKFSSNRGLPVDIVVETEVPVVEVDSAPTSVLVVATPEPIFEQKIANGSWFPSFPKFSVTKLKPDKDESPKRRGKNERRRRRSSSRRNYAESCDTASLVSFGFPEDEHQHKEDPLKLSDVDDDDPFNFTLPREEKVISWRQRSNSNSSVNSSPRIRFRRRKDEYVHYNPNGIDGSISDDEVGKFEPLAVEMRPSITYHELEPVSVTEEGTQFENEDILFDETEIGHEHKDSLVEIGALQMKNQECQTKHSRRYSSNSALVFMESTDTSEDSEEDDDDEDLSSQDSSWLPPTPGDEEDEEEEDDEEEEEEETNEDDSSSNNNSVPVNSELKEDTTVISARFMEAPYAHILQYTISNKVVFRCTKCSGSRPFKTKVNLKYHLCCGQTGMRRPYACNLCPRSFATKAHHAYHMHRHTGVMPFICNVCDRGFITKSKLKRHTDALHVTDNSVKYVCDFKDCGKVFNNKVYLRIHVKRHTRPVIKCRLCDKTFRGKSSLVRHRKVKHENPNPPKEKRKIPKGACRYCSEKFDTVVELRDHVKESHNINVFPCMEPSCLDKNVAFQSTKDLKRHGQTVHAKATDPVPFSCYLCSSSFRRKDFMRRHLRQVHKILDSDMRECVKACTTSS